MSPFIQRRRQSLKDVLIVPLIFLSGTLLARVIGRLGRGIRGPQIAFWTYRADPLEELESLLACGSQS